MADCAPSATKPEGVTVSCYMLPLSGVNNACGTLLPKPKRRLVINSHPSGSQRRLLELFASLWIAGLQQDWHERIIVMMAGSGHCSIGKQLVSEVLHSVLQRLPFSNQSVVVAHTTVNLWDYSGLHALWQWQWHPFAASDSYLYTLDSTTFESLQGLLQDKDSQPYKIENATSTLLYSFPLAHSNTGFIFGPGLIASYRDHYVRLGPNMSKAQAVAVEIGSKHASFRPFTSFGRPVRWFSRRELVPLMFDMYGNGLCRHYWYREVGIHKWTSCEGHGPCARDFASDQKSHTMWSQTSRHPSRNVSMPPGYCGPATNLLQPGYCYIPAALLQTCKAPLPKHYLRRYHVTDATCLMLRDIGSGVLSPRRPSELCANADFKTSRGSSSSDDGLRSGNRNPSAEFCSLNETVSLSVLPSLDHAMSV